MKTEMERCLAGEWYDWEQRSHRPKCTDIYGDTSDRFE